MTQRNTHDTIDWLRVHDTTSELGYNPDGQCLHIARDGRNIGPVYPSAFTAMMATPAEFRVSEISRIRRGMVGYYDDPHDSNPYGHIVTYLGWIKGAPKSNLHNLLCRTNSVQSGRTTVVRADYFVVHGWGAFQFAATWLNGVELDIPEIKPHKPQPAIRKYGKERMKEMIRELDQLIKIQANKGNHRAASALRRDKAELINTLEKFS